MFLCSVCFTILWLCFTSCFRSLFVCFLGPPARVGSILIFIWVTRNLCSFGLAESLDDRLFFRVLSEPALSFGRTFWFIRLSPWSFSSVEPSDWFIPSFCCLLAGSCPWVLLFRPWTSPPFRWCHSAVIRCDSSTLSFYHCRGLLFFLVEVLWVVNFLPWAWVQLLPCLRVRFWWFWVNFRQSSFPLLVAWWVGCDWPVLFLFYVCFIVIRYFCCFIRLLFLRRWLVVLWVYVFLLWGSRTLSGCCLRWWTWLLVRRCIFVWGSISVNDAFVVLCCFWWWFCTVLRWFDWPWLFPFWVVNWLFFVSAVLLWFFADHALLHCRRSWVFQVRCWLLYYFV